MRNPRRDPQRITEANRARTIKRVEHYYGKLALLQTWELAMTGRLGARAERIALRTDVAGLTKTVRQERAYLEHRAGPSADV